jgi:hypothetical protein
MSNSGRCPLCTALQRIKELDHPDGEPTDTHTELVAALNKIAAWDDEGGNHAAVPGDEVNGAAQEKERHGTNR